MFLLAYLVNPFSVLQNRSQDLLFTESSVSEQITLVTIDETSLESIGQWPWPRERFAELIRSAESADVIGIDVNFAEPSRLGEGDDDQLASTLKNADVPVVFSAQITEDGVAKPLKKFTDSAKIGFTNIIVDSDGVVRRTVKRQNGVNSFSFQITQTYLRENNTQTQSTASGQTRIHYYDSEGYPTVSFSELLSNDVPDQLIQDRILIVGATASDLRPHYNTPVGSMRPPQLHANMTDMFIAGDYFWQSQFLNGFIILLLAFAGVFIAWLARRFWVMLVTAGALGGLYFGITLTVFELNILLGIFYPLVGLLGGVVITAVYKYFVVLREEAVLEESYKTLSELLQNLTEGVVLLDSNDNVVASNVVARNAVTGATGLTFDQLKDTLTEHLDFHDVCKQVRKNGGKQSVRDIKLKDGTYYQLIFSAISPEDTDVLSDGGIIIVFHDMTQEKELARVREDFTSMMVHELRSPLDAVKKMSNHLNERDVAQEKKEKYLSLISNNASQVLTLVNDLLDVSKIEAGKFELRKEPTDIEKLISDRVDFYEPLSEERELSWGVAEDVPETVTLDPDRINQVMNNILSNAIKFTDETEGEVSVHVTARHPQELQEVDSIKVHWFDTGEAEVTNTDYVIFDIGDNGAGIPEEDINELFDKFKQFEAAAKTEKAGTGLGLAIVKGIIQQHDGIIGVASQEGEGTHFLVALPTDSD